MTIMTAAGMPKKLDWEKQRQEQEQQPCRRHPHPPLQQEEPLRQEQQPPSVATHESIDAERVGIKSLLARELANRTVGAETKLAANTKE